MKTKGIVTAGHPQTAWAGTQILEAGGNAFDAAIATLLAACVNEFCMSSLAGGTFFNVFTAKGESYIFDAFCQTPSQKRPVDEVQFYPHTIDFGGTTEEFQIGMGSIAVPGTLAGIFSLHEKLGTIPLKVLIEPALEIARTGSLVDDFQRFDYAVLESMLRVHPDSKALFIKPDNSLVEEGDQVKMPMFADFLEALGREGKDLFYKGEVARKLTSDSLELGGFLSYQDLENYKTIIRKPLSFKHRNNTVLTNGLPSIGGPILALAMSKLKDKRYDYSPDDKQHVQQLFSIFEWLEQIDRTPQGLSQLLAKQGINSPSWQTGNSSKWGSTTHFNIMDEQGNAVAVTTSNGEGSGYMLEGTGVMMNNMLGEAALLPNGFHSWEKATRLSSMMAPSLVLNEEGLVKMVLGTGGAGRIPTAIMQVLHYVLDYGFDIEKAVDGARSHLQHGTFDLEPGFFEDLSTIVKAVKYSQWDKNSMYFGGVHTIHRLSNGELVGVGDKRRSGVVRKV